MDQRREGKGSLKFGNLGNRLLKFSNEGIGLQVKNFRQSNPNVFVGRDFPFCPFMPLL